VKVSRLLERGNPLGEAWGTNTGKRSRDEWVLLPLRDGASGRGLKRDEECIQPKKRRNVDKVERNVTKSLVSCCSSK
jgi:hypothetical protein